MLSISLSEVGFVGLLKTFTSRRRSLFPGKQKQNPNRWWPSMTIKKACRVNFVRSLKSQPPRIIITTEDSYRPDLRVFTFADYIIALLTFLDTQPGKNYLPEAIPSITCTRCPEPKMSSILLSTVTLCVRDSRYYFIQDSFITNIEIEHNSIIRLNHCLQSLIRTATSEIIPRSIYYGE